MAKRLPPQPNEWINRERPIGFEFEKHAYRGYEGDVVSSALIAANQMHLARSFKYHRPRGILSMANHDANVLLQTNERTNIRADVEPIAEGKAYTVVNTIGGLRRDLTSGLQLFSRLLPVGFYYKAFYRPRWLFPYWEKLIRHAAGLGRVETSFPHERARKYYAKCDVLIIGAGPAGLAAATEAVQLGLKTVLVEEAPRLGGSLNYMHADEPERLLQAEQLIDSSRTHTNLQIMTGTYAAGYYDEGYIPLVESERLTHMQAGAVIFATGLIEQPAVFRNNDLPGIMLATAAQRLVHQYAVQPFEHAVVLTANAEGYAAALDLHRLGAPIEAIVDTGDPNERKRNGEPLANLAIASGISVIPKAYVSAGIAKNKRLATIEIRSQQSNFQQSIECDGLLMSVGWAPNAALVYQAGGSLTYDEALAQIRPDVLPAGVYAAGRLNGVFDLDLQTQDARASVQEAAQYLAGQRGDASPISASSSVARPSADKICHSDPLPIFAHPDGKEFVDLDEDITIQDISVARREGFDSIELLKRFSTIGMGPSQGKTSNMNGVRLLAHQRGEPVGVIGVTTPRPFLHPVPMGILAGRRMRRQWCTPMHEYHQQHKAELMEAGTWLRPMCYDNRGESTTLNAAVSREYRAVRESVGIIDVSTLGKIELFGADVIPLLEYAYTASFDKLKSGMTRYIFMVDGSGTLTDDGVAARFADDHFYITATSSHAQAVVRQLQLNADQLDLDVAIIDRTFQVAAMNLAGPRSREVLAGLTDMNLSESAFPYLAVRQGTIAGIDATLMRVGFVGELGFEIHCPANSAAALWEAIIAAGSPYGLIPFGVETQRLLRLEKGHLIFGQDTDGTTNPFEVNLAWGVRLNKTRFNGKHSLAILKERQERKLVGFKTSGTSVDTPIEECHLVISGDKIIGRVTSVSHSPHCQATIGLAMVELGSSEIGSKITIRVSDGSSIEASVSSLPFYDPENLRQKMTESQS